MSYNFEILDNLLHIEKNGLQTTTWYVLVNIIFLHLQVVHQTDSVVLTLPLNKKDGSRENL